MLDGDVEREIREKKVDLDYLRSEGYREVEKQKLSFYKEKKSEAKSLVRQSKNRGDEDFGRHTV